MVKCKYDLRIKSKIMKNRAGARCQHGRLLEFIGSFRLHNSPVSVYRKSHGIFSSCRKHPFHVPCFRDGVSIRRHGFHASCHNLAVNQ